VIHVALVGGRERAGLLQLLVDRERCAKIGSAAARSAARERAAGAFANVR
jgi:hypothetical protein